MVLGRQAAKDGPEMSKFARVGRRLGPSCGNSRRPRSRQVPSEEWGRERVGLG